MNVTGCSTVHVADQLKEEMLFGKLWLLPEDSDQKRTEF